jgi:uncharacterized SAM-dependent methyltransferase
MKTILRDNLALATNADVSYDLSAREEFEFTVSRLLAAVTSGKGLSANPYTNLAPFMYVEDSNDHRWKDGHSADTYYLGRDDRTTHHIAMNDPVFDGIKVQNYFDMGPGGEAAVASVSIPTGVKFKAKNWFFFDRSDALAIGAAELVQKRLKVNAHPIICDFFEKLPIVKSSTILTIPGGTIQNVETHDTPHSLQRRMKQIFSNYAYAVTGRQTTEGATNHLIVGFDANNNDKEILACYENDEFGHLVTGLARRAFDTSDFDYHVNLKRYAGVGFLSTGIRAKRDNTVEFAGRVYEFKADQFIPVLNSNRMPVEFLTQAISNAGWRPSKTWTATGRSHYQHYTRN